MEQIKKDPGLYISYCAIPKGHEDKFKWIYQQGGQCGHFEIPTRYYRLKTDDELKKDMISVSEIKNDSIVATYGDMLYLDRLSKSLHMYFDYTIKGRDSNIDNIGFRVNANDINNYSGFNYVRINIMRNSKMVNFN